MRVVAGYAIEDELGKGGMGRVLRVRHLGTGVERALKVLEVPGDPEIAARFKREAEALARATGAGAVPIHEAGVEQGRLYYVMDLMPGGSLRDRMKARGRLPWCEAAELVARLARMAARCHELGLVHRDLKPENVLFDERREPRLADFGCVRDLDARSLTATGELLGTLGYMSPEQLNGEKAGARADVFALGVILHELVAGERPFAGRTWSELALAVGQGERTPLVPSGLEAIARRALSLDAAGRPAADELARALESLVAGEKGALERTRRPTMARFVGAAALAAVLVAAASLLAHRPAPVAPPGPPPVAHERRPLDELRARLVAGPLAAPDAALVASALEDPGSRHSLIGLVLDRPAPFLALPRSGSPVRGYALLAGGRTEDRGEIALLLSGVDPGKEVAEAIVAVDAFVHRIEQEDAPGQVFVKGMEVFDDCMKDAQRLAELVSLRRTPFAAPRFQRLIVAPLEADARDCVRDRVTRHVEARSELFAAASARFEASVAPACAYLALSVAKKQSKEFVALAQNVAGASSEIAVAARLRASVLAHDAGDPEFYRIHEAAREDFYRLEPARRSMVVSDLHEGASTYVDHVLDRLDEPGSAARVDEAAADLRLAYDMWGEDGDRKRDVAFTLVHLLYDAGRPVDLADKGVSRLRDQPIYAEILRRNGHFEEALSCAEPFIRMGDVGPLAVKVLALHDLGRDKDAEDALAELRRQPEGKALSTTHLRTLTYEAVEQVLHPRPQKKKKKNR